MLSPPNNDTICYFEPMVVYEILSSHHCHKPKIIDKNELNEAASPQNT